MAHCYLSLATVLVLVLSLAAALVHAHCAADDVFPSDWRNMPLQHQRYHDLLRGVQWYKKKHHSTNKNKLPSSLKGGSLACDECELTAQAVFDFLQNVTVVNTSAGHDLRVLCRDLFKDKESDAVECEHIIDDIVSVLSHLANQLHGWQVNFPEIVCADVLSKCVRPCCTAPYSPEQIRLSYASRQVVAPAVNMTVSWITLNGTAESVVWWRVVSTNGTNHTDAQWQTAAGTSRTYHLGGWVGIIHGAVMTNLPDSSIIEYYVGSEKLGLSQRYHFHTLPLNAGTDERPLKVLAVADMGWGPNSDVTVSDMITKVKAGEADFLVHPGDIGYADGDQHWWDNFGRKVEPITARIPYMTVQGNHEQIWWNATGYKNRWWMPEPGRGAPNDATYYAFTAGPLKVLMLDTETIINTPDLDPVQLRWAKTVMEETDGSKFLFVLHHRPFYCSSYSIVDCTKWAQFLRGQAEQLYVQQGVDVVMVGHVHNYERTYPVNNNTVTSKSYIHPTSPVYLVNGAAGNREGQANFYTDTNPWSAVRTSERGYLYLSFAGNSENVTMKSQFIRSSDGVVRDEFTLVKKV